VLDAEAEVRDVEVHSYYVANNSVARSGWPALRIKRLTESGGEAQFHDEELMPGVEDLQIEVGLRDLAGDVERISFVPADSPALRDGQVIAVRLWLRVRAESTERGYSDARTLRYADAVFTPDASQAAQRRMLLERTVALRNVHAP
jgi:hypothetical protein